MHLSHRMVGWPRPTAILLMHEGLEHTILQPVKNRQKLACGVQDLLTVVVDLVIPSLLCLVGGQSV